jgi:PHD/YefM family antitoxin component YafN of YafNO toxin-antitoxin module
MFVKPIIKPSTEMRTDYNGISQLAKDTGSPIYITKNGSGDSVFMDLNTYAQREIDLDLRQERIEDAEKALRAKQRFINGNRGIPVEESRQLTMEAIRKTAEERS